jgi:hypothetical protein
MLNQMAKAITEPRGGPPPSQEKKDNACERASIVRGLGLGDSHFLKFCE